MIAFAFALPEESQSLVRALRDPVRSGQARKPDVRGKLGSHEVLIVHTGMGSSRACERVLRLLREHPEIDCLVSAGYAGGLDPRLACGALVLATNHSDPQLLVAAQDLLGDRCQAGGLADSAFPVETCAAKARLARTSGAIAVDMETAIVAQLCQEHEVPLLSLRVISDTACEELPVPFSVCFDPVTERPRPAALLRFLLRNPGRVRGFARFVSSVNRSRRVLTDALIELTGVLSEETATQTQAQAS